MSDKIEDKIVFAVGETNDGGAPVVLLGIPQAAWEHMRTGKTHTFDLTKLGLPVRLILYGAADHAGALATISEKLTGIPVVDMRGKDFSL